MDGLLTRLLPESYNAAIVRGLLQGDYLVGNPSMGKTTHLEIALGFAARAQDRRVRFSTVTAQVPAALSTFVHVFEVL